MYLGRQTFDQDSRDLVLKRKDGLYAYNLAVVVDDAEQGITRVIRGRDLLEQTPAQNCLHKYLGQTPPEVGHVPLAVGQDGGKLSKQNKAAPLNNDAAADNLRHALHFLGQPAVDPAADTVETILQAATAHWTPTSFAQIESKALVYPEDAAS